MWIIGVDGGGTKCKASLFDENGSVIATSETGPANIFVDFKLAISSIEQACEGVIQKGKKALSKNISKSDCFLSLGCAGASIPIAQTNIANWQHNYAKLALTTDIHISCLAANQGKDCALVITGTGSSIAVYQNKQITQFGGHGFLLGDIASGAWLGKNAVSWYLQALETQDPDINLQTALAEVLGTAVNTIIQKYGQANSAAFGNLVPSILSVQDNSPNVQAWLEQGLDYIANILQVHTDPLTNIYIDGGIAHIYQERLSHKLQRPVEHPKGTAVVGAFTFAKQILADV